MVHKPFSEISAPAPCQPDAVNVFTDSTHQFAELNGVKAQSVRKRYSQTGSYFGIRPLKLANRRLRWPAQIAAEGDSSSALQGAGKRMEVPA